MIPGMSHKIILQLATAALLASASTGTAATITINPHSFARFDSYGANVGVSGPNSIIANGNTLTGLIGDPNPASYQDYRTIWQFKLNDLGLTTVDIASATVSWTGNPIWGGYKLGIDVVNSDFTTWNTIPMYGSGSAITTDKWNGSGSNDLTSAFKNALANSTATSGLALRFYTAGSPGDYVAGGISNMEITVTTVPEPSSAALLGGLGSLLLIRRRRTA